MKRIIGTLSLLALALSASVLLAGTAPAMAPAVALPAPPQLAIAAPALPAWLAGAQAQPAAVPPDFLRPQAIPNCSIPCKGVHCAGGGFCRYNPDTGGCGCVYP